jgi:dephospho-CoA kinase
MFRSLGCRVIDADRIARGMLKPASPVCAQVKKEFGTTDRKALGRLVFADRRRRKKLESIVHPHIIRRILEEARGAGGLVVIDAPLLFETRLAEKVDTVCVVTASRENQLKRLKEKTGLTAGELAQRIRSQMPLSQKVRRADFIIDNNGSLHQTRKQVESIRRHVWKS